MTNQHCLSLLLFGPVNCLIAPPFVQRPQSGIVGDACS